MNGAASTRAGGRPTTWILRAGVACLAATLLPTTVAAEPSSRADGVAELRAKANRIAAELDELDRRTNELNEDFNDATLELARLRAAVADQERQVEASRLALDANRDSARRIAVSAYVGTGRDDEVVPVADDIATESRRRTYLTSVYGNREQVSDELGAAQKDLADQVRSLQQATAKADAEAAALETARRRVEATIAQRQELQQQVSGELAAAVEAERRRREAEAAEAAAKAAREAAARQAAEQRSRAIALVAPTAGGRSRSAAAPAAQPVPAVVAAPAPPPSDAPIAVRVALEQLGDPYRWAASGPNAFDCSGLVQFAYQAAGVSLPHSSRALRAMTQRVTEDQLQPGDLVFGGSPVHHVGIYIGNGEMVHAPQTGDVVKISGIYRTSKPVSFGRL